MKLIKIIKDSKASPFSFHLFLSEEQISEKPVSEHVLEACTNGEHANEFEKHSYDWHPETDLILIDKLANDEITRINDEIIDLEIRRREVIESFIWK